MRKIMIDRIGSWLLDSSRYADYLRGSASMDQWGERHDQVLWTLNQLNDVMILSLYDRMVRGDSIIPIFYEVTGYCGIKVGSYYGAIVS